MAEMTRQEAADRINATKSLNELLETLRSIEDDEGTLIDYPGLPTFGGTAPTNTAGVWSWDETHLLVGNYLDDFEIAPREDCDWAFR